MQIVFELEGDNMLEYVGKVFGSNIASEPYSFPKNAPYYLLTGYSAEKLTMNGYECILITPKNPSERLPVLKKHYEKCSKICGVPCALNLKKMTSRQRENLISSNIPFASEQQIYFPFWGAAFATKIKKSSDAPASMSPTVQLVFLKAYYKLIAGEKVNASIIASDLSLPKSSISMAIKNLRALNLISIVLDGTNKWLSLNGSNAETLQSAIQLMRRPILRDIYLKSIPTDIPYMLGGIKALAEQSILASSDRDGAYVYDKGAAARIPEELLISKQDFDDFGGYAAEIWRYNPALLTAGPMVDDISLLVCLKDDEDERVQKELDSLRDKYGLAAGEE